MTAEQLRVALSLEVINEAEPGREVTGVYIGDLLSWVMGRAASGCAWITIMSNVNVCAVAQLCDAAAVILAENAEPDPPAREAAAQRGINLYRSPSDAYTLAKALAACGL